MRHLGFCWAVAIALASGCGSRGGLDQSLDQAEQDLARSGSSYAASENTNTETESDLRLTAGQIANLRLMAHDLRSRANEAITSYDLAAHRWREAARLHGEASENFKKAAEDYKQAAESFQRITYAIIAAAASDLLLQYVCGPNISTGRYREMLKSEGLDLTGKDIDHIIPRAHGGLDRPWNYNPLESSINRSLGKSGMMWKLQNFPVETLRALGGHALAMLFCGG